MRVKEPRLSQRTEATAAAAAVTEKRQRYTAETAAYTATEDRSLKPAAHWADSVGIGACGGDIPAADSLLSLIQVVEW